MVHLPGVADLLDCYDDDDEIPPELAALILGQEEVGYTPPPIPFVELSAPWMPPRDRRAWQTFGDEF